MDPPVSSPPTRKQSQLRDLLTEHVGDLRAYVRSRCSALLRSHESTSDVVQSVCREILEDLARLEYRSEAEFCSLLFRNADRKLASRTRSFLAARRDVRRKVDGEFAVAIDAGERNQRLCDDVTPTPSEQAVGSELAQNLDAALRTLSPLDREVIELARIRQLPIEAIARSLGATPNAVRVRLHRALARLSARLPDPSVGLVASQDCSVSAVAPRA